MSRAAEEAFKAAQEDRVRTSVKVLLAIESAVVAVSSGYASDTVEHRVDNAVKIYNAKLVTEALTGIESALDVDVAQAIRVLAEVTEELRAVPS